MKAVVCINSSDKSYQVETEKFINKCKLMFTNSEVVASGEYNVQSVVAEDNLNLFIAYLNGATITINDNNYRDLDSLCKEFSCDGLGPQLSAFVNYQNLANDMIALADANKATKDELEELRATLANQNQVIAKQAELLEAQAAQIRELKEELDKKSGLLDNMQKVSGSRFHTYIGKAFVIRSRKDSRFVIDTEGFQKGKGPLKIYNRAPQGRHPNQTWTVDAEGHLISWDNRNAILCSGGSTKGVRTQIMQKTDDMVGSARWRLTDTGEIESIDFPNMVLDIKGGEMKNNTHLILWEGASQSNQQWDLERV